jgi:S1-C subfamily serine protease
MAVEHHNRLVAQYNATTDTIQRPVYLPYDFYQGTVRHGWRVAGRMIVGLKSSPFSADVLDSDFVRIGTKYNDAIVEYRRDDPIDIDTSSERLLLELVSATNEVCDQASVALLSLPIADRSTLSDEENLALAWFLHPFGRDRDLAAKAGVLQWVVAVAEDVAIPQTALAPPRVRLPQTRPAVRELPATAESIMAAYGDYVCEVTSRVGQVTARGSGCLISDDGLVLTCAHVLRATEVEVRVRQGPLQGTYQAVPVFVNDAMDVAILRAMDLRSESWLPLRLGGPPRQGERIVAIGNPSLPDGSPIGEAVSEGIVSSPKSHYWGAPRLIADVTIASGSSGGPLVSLESGDVMGVVVAVVRPRMASEGVSSSGFFCIAAPSEELGQWLGLEQAPPGDR